MVPQRFIPLVRCQKLKDTLSGTNAASKNHAQEESQTWHTMVHTCLSSNCFLRVESVAANQHKSCDQPEAEGVRRQADICHILNETLLTTVRVTASIRCLSMVAS
eukprot:105978-Amphidinium_carterae.1